MFLGSSSSDGLRAVVLAMATMLIVVVGVLVGFQRQVGDLEKRLVVSQAELERVEEKLVVCEVDGSVINMSGKEVYSERDVGLVSNLVEGLEVDVAMVGYRGDTIGWRSAWEIGADEGDLGGWGLAVWSVEERVNVTKQFHVEVDGDFVEGTDFPIFGGFENYLGTPQFWISDRLKEWSQSDDFYESAGGLKWYWGVDWAPKSISGVVLEIYLDKGVRKPRFVELSKGIDYYSDGVDEEEEIGRAREYLKKVADSFVVYDGS